MSSSQPPSSAQGAEFPRPGLSSSTVTDRPKPKGPSAKRKRIIQEKIVTEPIRPIPNVATSNPGPDPNTASGSGHTSYPPPPSENVKTSARTRSRRSTATTTVGSASYSSDVVPITPAAVDRKEKFPVTQRTLEVAGKIAELGEVQQIKCFACAEAESQRVAAYQDFTNLQARGMAPAISEETMDKLLSSVVCFYYDPAKLGIIKGVRMSNSNYGRCSNCMTAGCGCWWPTESLAPGVQAATAKALSTATASSSLASIVNAGSIDSSSRSSRRLDSQRQEQKPRRATAKRKTVVAADPGSMMVIESEPIARPSVRFQEPQAAALPEPAPIAQPISPVPQPTVQAARSPSPIPEPQTAPQLEADPVGAQHASPQQQAAPQPETDSVDAQHVNPPMEDIQPEQDPLSVDDQAPNPPAAQTEQERVAMLEAALAYMEAEADEEDDYDGEYALQYVAPSANSQDAAPGLPVHGDSGVDLESSAEGHDAAVKSVSAVEGQGGEMEADEVQDQPEVVDDDQPVIQQEDVKPLPPTRSQSPGLLAGAFEVHDANSASMTETVQQEASVEKDDHQIDDAANEAKSATPSESGMERQPLATINAEAEPNMSEDQPSVTMHQEAEVIASQSRSPVTMSQEVESDTLKDQPSATVDNEAQADISGDRPTSAMSKDVETNAPEAEPSATMQQEAEAQPSQSPIPATTDAETRTEEATTSVPDSPINEPLQISASNEPAQQSAAASEAIQLVSRAIDDADNEDAPIHTASTAKSVEDEYSFLFAEQGAEEEDGVKIVQEETVVLGVTSGGPDEEVAMNDEMVVETADEEVAMNDGQVIDEAAEETTSSNGKALIAVNEEEMAMNDSEADDDASEDADMPDGRPLKVPAEDVDMDDGEASVDPPEDKDADDGEVMASPAGDSATLDGEASMDPLEAQAANEGRYSDSPSSNEAAHDRAVLGATAGDQDRDVHDAELAAPTPVTQMEIVDEEAPMDAKSERDADDQDQQQFPGAPASPSTVNDEQLDFVPETQRDPVPEVMPVAAAAAKLPTESSSITVEDGLAMPAELAPSTVVEDSIQVTVQKELRQGGEIMEVVVEQDMVVIDVEAVEQEAAVTTAAETRSPLTPTGRTRSTRSTRAAAKAIKKSSSSTNKNKGNAGNGGHGSTFGIPSAPPEFELTPKWSKRLLSIPKADIIIQETSVPLKQHNRNLMSLDIPGVNKAFRKCTGCTLRECPCAPLPVDPDKRESEHTKYWQNSVLDSAGCLTCRVCGVICSFQLDPPIYGDYSTLPSPRTLDNMKLLPEDWDTRSALGDGFDGEEEVNENGHNQSAGESRPPSHPDPTFLQSNKCSGCALRQCPCIALPAGEGRGGGCIKCKECNVACSFNAATPQPDGKLVVWADADSTAIGGRERAGNDSKRVTTYGKRKLLAMASDEEDGAEQLEHGQLDDGQVVE
ncbi:hypothetical protein QFC22_005000 [Naganishia vaughanmartiniae]|uniref:Uncharacterized protein n=1 Tax=Naganishia vaughanmartiniae TaxID=1424756 RepID=A0ACC2WWG6_9TREE|nr:hypothetical protein QFC22_005000 [Naganishia vaughanmartiniae]